MPTYEYRCAKCDQHIEVYQSFSEPPLTKHDECGGKLMKVLSPAGIVLKGSGFYKNDSSDSARAKSKQRSESGPKPVESVSTSSESKGDSSGGGTTETKPKVDAKPKADRSDRSDRSGSSGTSGKPESKTSSAA